MDCRQKKICRVIILGRSGRMNRKMFFCEGRSFISRKNKTCRAIITPDTPRSRKVPVHE